LIVCVSAALGGVAGGLLWTSQGRYFALHSKFYAESSGIPVENINASFAGVFTTMFLGLEMFTKLLGTIVMLMSPQFGKIIIFVLYAAGAVFSCIMMLGLDDLKDPGTWQANYKVVSADAGAAARLMWLDKRMALIVPFQIAFGFASSFIPYYIFGTVIADSSNLGSAYVGLLSALIVLVGASMAIPSAWAANRFGKPIVMTVGGMCLSFTGLALYLFSDSQLGTWILIIPYLILYGVGRGTWENTNKAVIADFWITEPESCTTAFAAASFANGYASAMGYFTFDSVSRLGMAGCVTILSLFGMVTYYAAFLVHEEKRVEVPEEDKKAALRQQYWEHRGQRIQSLNSNSQYPRKG
jgi:hypothetical protein